MVAGRCRSLKIDSCMAARYKAHMRTHKTPYITLHQPYINPTSNNINPTSHKRINTVELKLAHHTLHFNASNVICLILRGYEKANPEESYASLVVVDLYLKGVAEPFNGRLSQHNYGHLIYSNGPITPATPGHIILTFYDVDFVERDPVIAWQIDLEEPSHTIAVGTESSTNEGNTALLHPCGKVVKCEDTTWPCYADWYTEMVERAKKQDERERAAHTAAATSGFQLPVNADA